MPVTVSGRNDCGLREDSFILWSAVVLALFLIEPKNSDDFCKCLSRIVPTEKHTVNLVPEGFSVYIQSASSPSGGGSTKELGT